MLTYGLFVIGFFLLIKGADLLVDGASSIAKKLKISSIVIGLTIVAFGTSMPEFVVNIFAAAKGSTEIAIGNVLGSNIANILLILGVSAMIYPIVAKRNTVRKEIPFSLLAALVVGITANDIWLDKAATAQISRIDGLIFLLFFIIFLYYTFSIAKEKQTSPETSDVKTYNYARSLGLILLGLVGLVIGGQWIVNGAIKIAELFNVSESLIGLTIVAIGTSLPELATSAIAAYKKQTDIAIGNAVGSNIFNIFWVLGFSAIIRPLPFNPASNIDILVTIAASLILLLAMYVGKKHILEKWQGALMILIYCGYIAFLIINQ